MRVAIITLTLLLWVQPVWGDGLSDIWSGIVAQQRGDHAEAIAAFTRAADSDGISTKNLAIALSNRGKSYEALHDYDRAVEDYTRSIALQPENPTIYYNRGNARAQWGNLEQAISDYDKAVELKPDYAVAYFNRGYVYNRLGYLDKAVQDFVRAYDLDPSNPRHSATMAGLRRRGLVPQ